MVSCLKISYFPKHHSFHYERSVVISLLIILCFLFLTILTHTQSWTQLSPTGSAPTTRFSHTAVYDTTNNLMTIFGGFNGSYYNDVWVLSTANGLGGTSAWTQLSPTGSTPTTRINHTAIYDDTNNRMTIFGGIVVLSALNDVWVLSTANGLGGTPAWTQLSPIGSAPTTRYRHTAIYDAINNRMTIYGGLNGLTNYLNDIWVLTNANGLAGTPAWTQITTTGSAPTTRYSHTAVYDTANNRMTIFGGYSGSTFLNDVWVLSNANGLGGTPTWTQLFPTGSAPTSRFGHTAIYDSANNRMTLFGGANSGYPYFNDVWVLTNANGLGGTPAWSQLAPTGSAPTTRQLHTAVYDANNNRMTIFGGYYNTPILNDVWVLDNADATSVPKGIWELLDE